MSEGVEWALHSCVNLAWAGPGRAVPAARLAAWHDLPAAYLNKQLQALARPLAEITLMDVVAAVEGPEEAFRCAEIRQQGPGGAPAADDGPACAIAHAMSRAELAWRRALAAEDLDGIRRRAEQQAPQAPARLRAWLAGTAGGPPGGGRPTARPAVPGD
ncbi:MULTISPECIES: Rrf2 family transcriptional regulator [unclassified Streptomyces]|uniref:RrF2 family transcriptional regulator n=1 Tax=unclassified Streptomyces TaxID=2593676 RepID=UPI002E1587BF|nr:MULTISPECIES: Rrf2 family transcriptional regulator [unclassified Streptomyces]WSR28457.1 Rrf2 family transcriptional regulator [Streptomyces sp. NBC_01205]